jgi:hypothetical protein
MNHDYDYEIPPNMTDVVRFDDTGNASHLGPMTAEGLKALMEFWFDCGFALFIPDTREVLCLFPAWYHRNQRPVPEPLTHSMSMHMEMWEVQILEDDEDEGEPGYESQWNPDDN